jgi:hypothetical protein
MKYNKLLLAAGLLFLLAACNKKIEQLQVNPNRPTSAPAYLLLQSVLSGIANGPGDIQPCGSVARWIQFFCRNYQYYGDKQSVWQNGPFDGYLAMKNVIKMEQEAKNAGASDLNPYKAIGKFARAYYFYNMSSMMGDIPMKAALNGTAKSTPAYDLQKDIFLEVLTWLDQANDDFATLYSKADNTLAGDFYYGNDLREWRKAVNVFKLRVLISLSNKDSDPDLNVKARFSAVLNDPVKYPLFSGASDNLQFTYVHPYNNYPTSPDNYGFDALRYNMAQTYVKNLTDLNDARVFITCEPAWAVADSLNNPVDFRAYIGAGTGESIATMYSKAINGRYSMINRKRYYFSYTAEPFVLLGYTEMCFNIAEAMNRGWLAGTAAVWYSRGILESMKFYGFTSGQTAYTATLLHSGSSLDINNFKNYPFSFDLNAYLASPAVSYAGGVTGLQQILRQKYLAFFQNSGWEAYFNYRRTGIPAFAGGTGIGNNGIIPKRWSYPSNEQSLNAVNWQAALQKQQFSTDDINGIIWLLK